MTAPRIDERERCSAASGRPACRARPAGVSRGRPSRRATISAREGSPRRAGSVADMSTPMNVPCIASRRRTRALGQRGAQDRVPGDARRTIEAHISAEAGEHPRRGSSDQRRDDPVDADPLEREPGEPERPPSDGASARAARAATRSAGRAAPARARARASAGGAAGIARPRSAGDERRARTAARGASPGRAARAARDRVLVDAERPRRRRAATRSARRARGRGAPSRRERAGSSARSRSASASAVGVAARHQHAVAAVADDVAVAGDVRRDDRRAGGERLGQHHAEALAAQRRRAEHVGLAQARVLLVVVDLAERGDAARRRAASARPRPASAPTI